MAIWAAIHRKPKRIVLGDSLEPLTELWKNILQAPGETASRYKGIWLGQQRDETSYFNRIRERFNAGRDPVDLLYLLCRCVKNAVRFNAQGHFTQSVDKRRLGMHPDKMRAAMFGAAETLGGRTIIRHGDWLQTVCDAGPIDFIYMDPPYFGTSAGRDHRYAASMSMEHLVAGLRSLRTRNLRYALSYDGACGEKQYGPSLPNDLMLQRFSLDAGRSSQATLNGVDARTTESLYLSSGGM